MNKDMVLPNTADGLTAVEYIASWSRDRNPFCSPEEMIEKLFAKMDECTLYPAFEDSFLVRNIELYSGQRDLTQLFGNFWDYSFVFSIYTKDEALISRFEEAMKKNMASEVYKNAKIAIQERDATYRKSLGIKTMQRENYEKSFEKKEEVYN